MTFARRFTDSDHFKPKSRWLETICANLGTSIIDNICSIHLPKTKSIKIGFHEDAVLIFLVITLFDPSGRVLRNISSYADVFVPQFIQDGDDQPRLIGSIESNGCHFRTRVVIHENVQLMVACKRVNPSIHLPDALDAHFANRISVQQKELTCVIFYCGFQTRPQSAVGIRSF